MKVFYLGAISLITSNLTDNVQAESMNRILRGGRHGRRSHGGRSHGEPLFGQGRQGGNGHGGRGPPPFTQAAIQEECEAFVCDGIDTVNLNCAIERPEHPKFGTMTEEEREDAKVAMQAVREELHQQVLSCTCCANFTIEELLPRDGEDSTHGFGPRPGHHNGGRGPPPFTQATIQEECEAFVCDGIDTVNLNCAIERPEHPKFGTMTEEEREDAKVAMQAVREELHQQVLSCACCANVTMEELFPRFGRHGQNGRYDGTTGTTKVDHILETQCPNHSCPADEGSESETVAVVMCPRLDTVMAMSKEERRQTTLDCICCQGDDEMSELMEELINDEQTEVSVLLSSLLPSAASAEPEMQESSASQNIVTMVSGMAASFALFFVVVV